MSEPERDDPALADLEGWLHAHIPLSAAMAVRVRALGPPELVLAAPLEPNRNHHGTAFGGSGATLAILAGWSCIHLLLLRAGLDARLVIQRQSMEWLRAIDGDFEAACPGPTAPARERFVATVRQKGRARLAVDVELRCSGVTAGRFAGEFVGLCP